MWRANDLIMDDIHKQMMAVDTQISELENLTGEMIGSSWHDGDVTELRDANGHFLMTPLLQTKSQLLLAEVLLKKEK